jgi:hypothetical protein
MAFTLCGQYHHGCAAVAVAASLLGLLVAVAFTAQVCLNKALPPFHPADLPSSPSPSPLLPQPGDLLVIDSTSSLLLSAKSSTGRLFYCRLRLTPGNSLPDVGSTTSSGDPIASFVFYLQRWQATYPSVAWNKLHQLGRPIYNYLEQSFRPAVSASDAPTAHRRRSRHSLLVISSSSEDLFVTWLLDIIYLQLSKNTEHVFINYHK